MLARVLGPDVTFHHYTGRNDVELLGDFLPDPLHHVSACADLFFLGQIVNHVHPGKVLGKRAAARLFAPVGGNDNLVPILAARLFRDFCLQVLRLVEKTHLPVIFRHGKLLCFPTEKLTPEQGDLLFQMTGTLNKKIQLTG